MVKFSELTDEALIEIAKSTYDAIYVIDCFGTSDLVNNAGASSELRERGYIVEEKTFLEISN